MAKTYDAVVIGAGPPGEVVAGELADGGMSVAVCERELVGGECGYWACIPSKTLLRPGEAIAEARHAPGAREAVTGKLDSAAAFEWRDFQVSDYDDAGQAKWLEDKGVRIFRGNARIEGRGKVAVAEETIETERIVVATGSDPVIPPVEGLRALEGLWTNREATGAKEVPERLIILGGGPVGVEIGQAFARMGASVAIAEAEDRVLFKEAERAGELLGEALEAEGIELKLGAKATAAERRGDGYALRFEDGTELRGEKLLVATGRRARTEGLGLESAGIEPDEKGSVEVDERLRAGDAVWAVGDVTGTMLFTHLGKYQARVAAANIAGKDTRADYRAIPAAVFTDPQVASVGVMEGEGIVSARYDITGGRLSTYERPKRSGFVKLAADASRRVLVGAIAVGPEAGEWLGQLTLAVRAEISLDVLLDTIQPYPTFSESIFNGLRELEPKLA